MRDFPKNGMFLPETVKNKSLVFLLQEIIFKELIYNVIYK